MLYDSPKIIDDWFKYIIQKEIKALLFILGFSENPCVLYSLFLYI